MRNAACRSLAIGFFDGVHLGHRRILAGVAKAITFKTHPLAVLDPKRRPQLLMTYPERERAIQACGVEEVLALDFTPELAAMPAAEFADRYLRGFTVRCGANWSFGKGGRDNAATLQALGWQAEVVPYAEYLGQIVSSTRIREAIGAGRLTDAAKMLGRPWRLTGKVMPGKGEGRKLGFPTVNLVPDSELATPPAGVYECRYRGLKAICNYGVAPTFGERAWAQNVCEVHVLEAGEPCGSEAAVELLRFIRPERKFAGLSALQAQIRKDIDGILQSV